jgi:hypothetical protein
MLQYDTLDPQRKEIRLLLVLPRKRDQPIECTLQTVSLDNPPEFEALSYVWGDASIKKPVTVNGAPHSVTVNLEAALRTLRDDQKTRTLWVDAICINQDDVPEKNIQVPQMAQLYSAARAVVVWLGPSTPNIELAVSWAHTYAAKEFTYASSYWLKLDAKALVSNRTKVEKYWATIRALEGYFELLALPYWNRMWTFQEYRLPSDEPVCHCGSISFRATTMLGATEDMIHEAGYRALTTLSQPPYLDGARKWHTLSKKEQDFALRVETVGKTIREKSTAARKNAIVSPKRAREPWRNKESPLMYLVITTAERQCFDARDKVFALYGMVPAVQEVYPPDYFKPIKTVTLETAAFMVNYERGPIMWSSFGLRDDRLSDTTYPSWVPDFAQADIDSPNIHRAVGDRTAPSLRKWDEPPPARVSDDLKTLNLWGRNMGACKVAFHFGSTAAEVLRQIEGLLRTPVSALPNQSLAKQMRKADNLVTRLAYACVIHHVRKSDFSPKEIVETFEAMFENDSSRKGSCWYMIQDSSWDLVGKTFLVTEGGCFGVGVAGIKDGDIVTVPPQVRLPLVLTKEAPASPGGHGYYKMVGTAWIDGIMEGEFIDPHLVAETEGLALQEFLVH